MNMFNFSIVVSLNCDKLCILLSDEILFCESQHLFVIIVFIVCSLFKSPYAIPYIIFYCRVPILWEIGMNV
jgi:hypothetical protein